MGGDSFFLVLKSLLKSFWHKIEMRKYNNFTIAEFFRKQGAQIGEGCNLEVRSLGTEPYIVKIGNNVAVTSGVHFHTHDGGTWILRNELPDIRVFGPIVIHDNCLIGTNSHIMPNVTIGPNSIVGPNSVVITDVPPDSIVIGVPARKFGSVSKYKENCVEKWAIQKPPEFKLDNIRHYDYIKNPEPILAQLRNHLSKVFHDKLK